MKILREQLSKCEHYFSKGGKLEKLFPLYEAIDTFLYTPGSVTTGSTHIRDGVDLKRVMIMVVVALIPAFFMAFYNTGYQANLALMKMGISEGQNWQQMLYLLIGCDFDPYNHLYNIIHGAFYFVPIYLVTNIVGGLCELLFSIVRKHEINEGFLVTGSLFPLILPPTIPLWQVAIGIAFGVIIGKEVFGGTGRNFLNPALVGRAFLFFAYPAQISGDQVWIAAKNIATFGIDGLTGATSLALIKESGNVAVLNHTWLDAFLGFIPGSMGETSALAILIGAFILIFTGVGSWRIMSSILLGAFVTTLLFNYLSGSNHPAFLLPFHWHLVLGGFLFGTVFMATDPVSASMTFVGQYIYGALIGILVILVRMINPAYPEGMMLAILFGNAVAPVIDYYVVKCHIAKRKVRYGV